MIFFLSSIFDCIMILFEHKWLNGLSVPQAMNPKTSCIGFPCFLDIGYEDSCKSSMLLHACNYIV